MWANHINQWVHLTKPEFPRVFTNFENQVGEYSVAHKEAEEDFEIISKIEKNEFNYDLIIQYKSSKVYDILHYRKGVNITEDYGYTLEDKLTKKKEGDIVYKGDPIYASSNYDEHGNFSYGTNLKSIFLAYKGLTYEDGIVISESAAEKLKSHKIEETMFSINSNDIMLNIYGDKYYYKSFPKVGDEINNRILTAIRRIDYGKILYDFQSDKMREIDNLNDTMIFTSGGKIIDIDIYSNIPLGRLKEKSNEFKNEIIDVYEKQLNYYNKLAQELEKVISVRVLTKDEEKEERNRYGHVIKHPVRKEDNPNKYTEELGYYWKLAHEFIDEKIQWRHEGKTFDSFKIKFTILKENPLTPGAKITGRLNFHSLRNSVMNYK